MSIKDLAAEYEASTQLFLQLVNSLNESDLDRSDSEGWTPRQVIHHVADSEAQSYARLRRLIAEPGTQIQGYDEGKWAENPTLDYSNSDTAASLEVFAAVRKSSHLLLQRLSEAQLDNNGVHTESGEYSVRTWLQTYTNHPKDHAEQIRKQLR
jgi:S-formylglutathione hydrolase FrmB